MKQCIKFTIITLLTVLLHKSAIDAADFLCTPTSNQTENCILSQTPSAKQVVHNFYNHFLTASLCIEHVDNTHVPGNKMILLRTNMYKMQQQADSPECDRLLYLPPHPVPDANYYIIGLRRIII